MAGRAKSGKRQSSGLAVRQWLGVGAAGVGLGVAAWAGCGVAAADSSGGASNGGASHSSGSVSDSKVTGPGAHGPASRDRVRADSVTRASAGPARAANGPIATPRSAAAAASPRRVAVADPTNLAQSVVDTASETSAPQQSVSPTASVAKSSVTGRAVASQTIDETPSNAGYVSVQTRSVKELFDGVIYNALDAVSNALSKLPPSAFTDFLNNAWLTFRRTFFDQAPTLAPSQTTGQLSGTITGTLGGVDPDGMIRIVVAQQNPGIQNWVETLGHQRGYLQFRWQRTTRALTEADGPTAEIVNFGAVPSTRPYYTHNAIGNDDWRARIALRQKQIGYRMVA